MLRAKESAHEKTREALRKEEQAHIATMAELDEARAQLAQAQKEIEHANLRLTRDADRLADEVDALIRLRIIDSRSPAADALLDFRDPPSTPRSCRLAEVEKQLAQAERGKAAMRAECEFLLKTRTELALKVPILEEGVQRYRIAHEEKNVHYQDVADAAVKEWERDHGALVPQEGETQPAKEEEFRAGLPALAIRQACSRFDSPEGQVIFSANGTFFRWHDWATSRPVELGDWDLPHWRFRPHGGRTWAEVEAMAAHRDAKTGNGES